MATFTFFRQKLGSSTPSFEIQEFDRHVEAQAYAKRLLGDNPHYTFIEVFANNQRLAIIERDSASSGAPVGQTL